MVVGNLLTAIPSPPQQWAQIGPIHTYAIMILLGILVAWYLGEVRYTAKSGPEDTTADAALWGVLAGIIGARVYHVITTPGPYFGANGDWTKIFRIWEGGLGIWGAIAFGAVAVYLYLHKQGLRFAAFADAVAPGILIAQAIGRLGNWFNQELFGRPTDLPWALRIDPENIPAPYDPGTTFHPTFLYEMLWCLAGAALLIYLERKFRLRGGQVGIGYVLVYTAGRVWIESLRIDEAQIILGLRLNVWVSILVFALAAVAFIVQTRRLRAHPQLADIRLENQGNSAETATSHS
ncbi:MAG: prolipoprotein diacylglyceryl transferase [Trueperella sp.]|nr:prolipoprotein diacylglyceryl transferase [Trueperella sp.]